MASFDGRGGALLLSAALALGCGDGGEGGERVLPEFHASAPLAEPPPNVVGGFVAELPPYQVAPGGEEFPCWIIPIELGGPSRIVGGAKMTTGNGLHHGNLTTRPKTGEGLRSCPAEDTEGGAEAFDLVKGGGWIFSSSTQLVGEEWQSFPEGHGYRIDPGYEIVAHMHYLNTTTEPLTVAPRYEWFTIDESTLVNRLAPFGFILGGFEIPPLQSYTGTGACRLPESFQVMALLPHMHALGTAMTAELMGGAYDGARFLDSVGYDPDGGVQLQYDPAVDLSVAEGVRFSCTWNNTFAKPIGEGTGDNEMCMLFGYGYPYDHAYLGYAVSEDNCFTVAVPSGDE